MIGITLTSDQIRTAPKEVRQWIEHEAVAALGHLGSVPAQSADVVSCTSRRSGADPGDGARG